MATNMSVAVLQARVNSILQTMPDWAVLSVVGKLDLAATDVITTMSASELRVMYQTHIANFTREQLQHASVVMKADLKGAIHMRKDVMSMSPLLSVDDADFYLARHHDAKLLGNVQTRLVIEVDEQNRYPASKGYPYCRVAIAA